MYNRKQYVTIKKVNFTENEIHDHTKIEIESLENEKELYYKFKTRKKFIIDMCNMPTPSFEASIYFNSQVMPDFSQVCIRTSSLYRCTFAF